MFYSTESELMYSGGWEDILHTKCWIGKSFYNKINKYEFGVCLSDSAYKSSRFEFDDEDGDDSTEKTIVQGMLMYDCKTLDEFVEYCKTHKLPFAYDILKYPAHKEKIELLRPRVQKILDKLYN